MKISGNAFSKLMMLCVLTCASTCVNWNLFRLDSVSDPTTKLTMKVLFRKLAEDGIDIDRIIEKNDEWFLFPCTIKEKRQVNTGNGVSEEEVYVPQTMKIIKNLTHESKCQLDVLKEITLNSSSQKKLIRDVKWYKISDDQDTVNTRKRTNVPRQFKNYCVLVFDLEVSYYWQTMYSGITNLPAEKSNERTLEFATMIQHVIELIYDLNFRQRIHHMNFRQENIVFEKNGNNVEPFLIDYSKAWLPMRLKSKFKNWNQPQIEIKGSSLPTDFKSRLEKKYLQEADLDGLYREDAKSLGYTLKDYLHSYERYINMNHPLINQLKAIIEALTKETLSERMTTHQAFYEWLHALKFHSQHEASTLVV